jgi:hypothetical protein
VFKRVSTVTFHIETFSASYFTMDAVKEDPDKLLPPLFAHLSTVESSPATALDVDLLKRAERSLDFSTPQPKLLQVLASGERLLPNLQQDPTPLTRLIEKPVSLIPFEVLQPLIPPDKLQDGLQSPLLVTQPVSPVQLLCLAYLMRASQTPSGAAFVATNEPLSKCLFEVWLLDENTEVADRALEVINALLTVDHPQSNTLIGTGMAQGQGLFWRRIFHDPALYTFIFEATRGIETPRDVQGIRTPKQRQGMPGITQGRLFDFISRLAALDWTPMTMTAFHEFEAGFYGLQLTEEGGLLCYAALHMIDKNDILMVALRQELFANLMESIEKAQNGVNTRLLETIREESGVQVEDMNGVAGLHL